MKRILVPTDLSNIAERGLRLAVEIAKRNGAEIYLINFTRHPLGATFSAMGEINSKFDDEENLFNIELLQSNRSKLNLLGLHYSQEGVTINTEIVDDELKSGVDEFLKRYAIDLVVMGTSGEENVSEQFTGNNTEKIITISTCPVISVRDEFHIENFSNIVLALDMSDDVNIYPGVAGLKHLADAFNATIHLVHVADPAVNMKKDMEIYFHKIGNRFMLDKYIVQILSDDNESRAVIEYARKTGAGLVAVLKSSKDGFFRIFTDHFSNRVVKEVGRPVFTYNLQNV